MRAKLFALVFAFASAGTFSLPQGTFSLPPGRPYFNSAFVFSGDSRFQSNTTAEIEVFLRSIKTLEIRHVTFQSTSEGTAYPSRGGKSFYPCTVQNFQESLGDTVGKLLQAADVVGIDVSLGLMNPTNGNCMPGLLTNDAQASLTALAEINKEFVTDLHHQYAHHASLNGFYLTVEPSNVCFPGQAKLLGAVLLQPIAQHIASLGLVSSISPFFNANWGGERQEPAAVGAFWAEALGAAPALHRIEVQDKVSMYPLQVALPFLQQIGKAAASTGVTMWSDVEIFRIPGGAWNGTEIPAPFPDIKQQLSQESSIVGGFTFWCFNCWMDPSKNTAGAEMYHEYQAYLPRQTKSLLFE